MLVRVVSVKPEPTSKGAVHAEVLVRIDGEQPGGPDEFAEMMCLRDHHDQHSVRAQHPVELARVARGEDVEHHVTTAIGERERPPHVADHSRGPGMRAGAASHGGLGEVDAEPVVVRDCVEHGGQIVPGAGTHIEDESRR